MPRNHHPAASTLRNRNRITNKTRLKIYLGSLDADAVLIPDEDEEKYHLTNLVAGVDAEDANEHHLQEVLSAAHRNNANNRHSREAVADNKANVASQSVFIPTPDSTGIVDNYEEWYPANKWKDPATYVCTSTTVEETNTNGLSGGFVYYMDERDHAWLEKNNEQARGEGTSVQGAVSVSGTRASARSAKAKGKEPELCQPAIISEDEFELMMALYEKVTHERTEFLHHGLETGMEFPAFADYQDVFSAPLAPTLFATYIPPSWTPEPQTLLRIAQTVYPHWKERRIDRGGHCIIPTLNGDESDTLNESYVCFRRRETKAVRKTRASQATSSDKLVRLQHELTFPLELAKSLLIRETLKKDNTAQSQGVWEKRLAFADLKRKFPAFSDKGDEELLVDKERPVKKPDTSRLPLKLKPHDDPTPRKEVLLRPKERVAMIRELVETTLSRQKDLDLHWEDQVDNPYQASPIPYASRLFKYIPPLDAPSWPSSNSDLTDDERPSSPSAPRMARAVRMRYGRGGRIHLDRRNAIPAPLAAARIPRSSLFDLDEPMDVEVPEGEQRRQLEEQWKFDSDDTIPIGPDRSDEQDRILIDDYETIHLRHTMTLFSDMDHTHLLTDPTLVVPGAEGGSQIFLPYRLGMLQQSMIRRDAQGVLRPLQSTMNGIVPAHPIAGVTALNGHQVKKMLPPHAGVQMRISSNGGMRPPMTPVSNLHLNGGSSSPASHQMSPPQTLPDPVAQHSSSMNDVSRAAINLPQVDVHKLADTIASPAIPDGVALTASPQPDINGSGNVEVAVNGTPPRPKPQIPATPQSQQHLGTTISMNGYHLTSLPAAYSYSQSPPQLTNISNGGSGGGLSQQQMRDLKSAFANMPGPELGSLQNASRVFSSPYMHLSPSVPNMNGIQLLPGADIGNLKLSPTAAAAARQMQWGTANGNGSPIMQMQQISIQRPGSVVNGNHLMDAQLAVNGGNALSSPNLGAAGLPVSPSANGMRSGMRNGMLVNGQPHSISSLMPHSPSPLPNISHSHSQSPTRMPMTPNMAIIGSSPSLQHQQTPQTQSIGSSLNGY